MKAMKIIMVLITILFFISLYRCIPPEKITLPGDLTGYVTDAETSEPVQEASVKLYQYQSNITIDTTNTGNDGSYLFKNLAPTDYEIQASKFGYAADKKNAAVVSAESKILNFALIGIPVPNISANYLDFGLDSDSIEFTISRIGKSKFTYVLTPGQEWITVYPSHGEVSDETDTLTVSINRTGLSESIMYKETITVASFSSHGAMPDIIIEVYLNGVMDDRDKKYYPVIKIGTQIWMAENLNIGTFIQSTNNQSNNGTIEKYCYNNNPEYCLIYGGLYQWDEMMQYNPSDTGTIGTTQGICPTGWHLPTKSEFITLINNLGGRDVAGGKMKETGTEHWNTPNTDATNESGFSALPGGRYHGMNLIFGDINQFCYLYTSTEEILTTSVSHFFVSSTSSSTTLESLNRKTYGLSVRCVKDP